MLPPCLGPADDRLPPMPIPPIPPEPYRHRPDFSDRWQQLVPFLAGAMVAVSAVVQVGAQILFIVLFSGLLLNLIKIAAEAGASLLQR